MNKKKLGRTIMAGGLLAMLLTGLPATTRPAQAATFTVKNTNDSGAGSLRQAIIEANTNPGPDTIAFNINTGNYNSLVGKWIITLSISLPCLSDSKTIIDGTTQTTYQGDTNPYGPEVGITGLVSSIFCVDSFSNANQILGLDIYGASGDGIRIIAGASGNIIKDNIIGTNDQNGVHIWAGASGNVIAGNVINGNHQNGILITGSTTSDNMIRSNNIEGNGYDGVAIYSSDRNYVGGSAGYRNTIGGNTGHGVYITGGASNEVAYNYVGVDATGAAAKPNGASGVWIEGGATRSWIKENVISGNHEHGVYITGGGTDWNMVHHNIIGADAQVTTLIPNGKHGVGIYGGAQGNDVGPLPTGGQGNVIVGSGWSGVVIVNSGTNDNNVAYNAIGTDWSGTATNLGNGYYGVAVVDGARNLMLMNHIAYNGTHTTAAGVRVQGLNADGNRISANSIHDNSGLGIQLVSFGNQNLAAPNIAGGDCGGVWGGTWPGLNVEVFSDGADEGRFYEGSVTAANSGAYSWSGRVYGPHLTVTATDSQGNTSQFSSAFDVGLCPRLFLPLALREYP